MGNGEKDMKGRDRKRTDTVSDNKSERRKTERHRRRKKLRPRETPKK